MRRSKKKIAILHVKARFLLLSFVLLAMLTGLVIRIVYLTTYQRDFLQEQGEARSSRVMELPAYRGVIHDRHGHPLAMSSPVVTIWADPRKVNLDATQLQQLAKLLQMQPQYIQSMLDKHKTRGFLYLKRQLPPAIAAQIAAMKLPGIHQQREYSRFYPESDAIAHIIGFTNIDERGQEGIELAYNDILTGAPGLQRVIKDRLGNVVEVLDQVRPAQPGEDIVLSLDRHLQYIAYRELLNVAKEYNAESASLVMLSVKTGEVLAMANVPSFNPNQRPKTMSSRYRNRAVTDLFEPGSTLKPFSISRVLQDGHYKPLTVIETKPGWMTLNRNLVRDYRYLGELTVSEVIQKSSNIGTAKLALSLPANALWDYFRELGLGQTTGSQFPGESPGLLPKPHKWSDFAIATLSFGYGVAVTNLQLAHIYATLVGDGIDRPVSFLKQKQLPKGRRVIAKSNAKQVKAMLEKVVMAKGGTASRARVPGYRVLGKTGTVRMLGKSGYDKNRHVGMFVGAIPASDPEVVISVIVTDPKKKYYGGIVAAPVFATVAKEAMRVLGITPDDHQASSP